MHDCYISGEGSAHQVMIDSSGVKRHYSTGDMLNEKDDFDTRRPKSEGFNQSMYRLNSVGRKRYSFGVSFGHISHVGISDFLTCTV